ncbi:hypothetical protein ACLOJK_026961, partial [Asimina triloba]
ARDSRERIKAFSVLYSSSSALAIVCLLLGLGFVYCLKPAECSSRHWKSGHLEYPSTNCRAHSVSLTDFGGIGDGVTLNTKAFQAAVAHLSDFSSEGGGGGQLFVPPGKWLTGSFNLTSHFTLYLHKDAEILGSQWNGWLATTGFAGVALGFSGRMSLGHYYYHY